MANLVDIENGDGGLVTRNKINASFAKVDGLVDKSGTVHTITSSDNSPTITTSASTTVTGNLIFPALSGDDVNIEGDPNYNYYGCVDTSLVAGFSDSVTGALFSGEALATPTNEWRPRITTVFDGAEIEFKFRAASTGLSILNVWINDTEQSQVTFSGTSGSSFYLKFVFTGSEPRKIGVSTIRCDFAGCIVPEASSVVSTIKRATRVATLSNSIQAGLGNDTDRFTQSIQCAVDSRKYDHYNVSIGSTGYIELSPYIDRLPDLAIIDPDIIIFGDHYNDLARPVGDVTTAMQLLISSLKTQHPNTRLIMLDGWVVNENLSAAQIELSETARGLAVTNSIEFYSYTDPAIVWNNTPDYQVGVSVKQGQTYRYNRSIWKCKADHVTSDPINTFGFAPQLIVNDDNQSTRLLADSIHPTLETSKSFGASISKIL